MAGKLCVSVIEARGVQADYSSELSFYVKLKLGPAEVLTDIARNTDSPKFLKDVRISVPNPASDVLRIELLQVGPRGDLVVGKDEIKIIALTTKGTVVHWFQLKAPDRSLGAELCLVLRYLSAEASRPLSPSYALITRQAKEKALDSSAPSPSISSQQQLPQSAFNDSPQRPSTSYTASPPPEPARNPASDSGAGGPARKLTSDSRAGGPAPPEAGPGAAGAGEGAAPQPPQESKPAKGKSKATVPLPLAILGGVLIGVVMHLWKSRPIYYEVQEGDTLCSLGGCFNIDSRDKNEKKNDPDGVYAGDRDKNEKKNDPDGVYAGDR
eukprot:gene20027-26742_t